MSDNTAPTWPLTRRLFSPMAVLLYVYVIYFLVGLSTIYEFAYWELMNFGLRMIGFQPTTHTTLLYAYAAVVLILGFMLGAAVARWISDAANHTSATGGHPWNHKLVSLGDQFGALPVVRDVGPGYALAVAGWAFAFAANATQLAMSGRVSLFDIATRWQQSPVLVFLAALNIMFVPGLFVFARSRGQRVLAAVLFAVAVVGLGLLGARHLPAKLLVSTFLAIVFVAKPRNILKMGLVFFLLLALAMGVIGSISKSGIYGPSATAKLALALTYADSAGTTYNLDRIVRMTPPTGVYKGALLKDSALALLPGFSSEYANYQLGRYLGGREYFQIGGQRIDRSVSLAPTLLGAPYADWGVPGVVGQMIFFGMLFGYLQTRARQALWIVPPFVIMASYIINGVNAGAHNPNTIAFLGLALVVCLTDALIARRAPSLYLPIEKESP
jgi:hypothetical protein